MTFELARVHLVEKPWGIVDIPPWLQLKSDGRSIGEIWFERPSITRVEPALLMKLLLTSQPLSIQVHPGDAYAQSMGLVNGKTEAWYVLSAEPQSKVALGLNRKLSKHQLRAAIDDGSIKDLVSWKTVRAGEIIFVPAGTIHAIGAGLIIAEIQQRSDTTFRLFDYGRHRALHAEQAIDVADLGPANCVEQPARSSSAWNLLCTNGFFSIGRLDLAAGTSWHVDAEHETWIFVLHGDALAGSRRLSQGQAAFAQQQAVDIQAGSQGLSLLVATSKPGVEAQVSNGIGEKARRANAQAPPLAADVPRAS